MLPVRKINYFEAEITSNQDFIKNYETIKNIEKFSKLFEKIIEKNVDYFLIKSENNNWKIYPHDKSVMIYIYYPEVTYYSYFTNNPNSTDEDFIRKYIADVYATMFEKFSNIEKIICHTVNEYEEIKAYFGDQYQVILEEQNV